MDSSFNADYELEYHTFLHHSQTLIITTSQFFQLEYHTFLHHSQTARVSTEEEKQLEYHTFLHHSQTDSTLIKDNGSLSTIRFYIILKPRDIFDKR